MHFIAIITIIHTILFITTTNCWEINKNALSSINNLQGLLGPAPNPNNGWKYFQPSLLTKATSNELKTAPLPYENNINVFKNLQNYLDELSTLYKIQTLNESLKVSPPLMQRYASILRTPSLMEAPFETLPFYFNQPNPQYIPSKHTPEYSVPSYVSSNFSLGFPKKFLQSETTNRLTGGYPLNDRENADLFYNLLKNPLDRGRDQMKNDNPDLAVVNYLVPPAILHSLAYPHLQPDFYFNRRQVPPNYRGDFVKDNEPNLE